MLLVVLRANGDLACVGFGSGRVDLGGPLTLIAGTDGVIDIEGALTFGCREGAGESLTLMVGTDGVTDMEGGVALGPWEATGDLWIDIEGIDGVTEIEGGFTLAPLRALLFEIDGVSWTAIVGMGGAGDD
jgi:hypothetical protein